jgi:phosphatidylserine/phosphatidylglycerophosphate/cardiolipin synthase-like enzyme
MGYNTGLIDAIQIIANSLPFSVVTQLGINLQEIENINNQTSRTHIMHAIINPDARDLIGTLIDEWEKNYPYISGDVVGLAVTSASSAVEYNRRMRTIDLVWTGPLIHQVNLRQTENVLLEIIQSAKHHLHIVSFAVYKATRITNALLQALDRGIIVSIYLETQEIDDSKSRYDTKRALGKTLAQKANVYSWSTSKRQITANNKYGVLHAKTAIADTERFFITSANLTDHAMTLNIELGVLIQDRDSAIKLETQLHLLVENDIFVLI